MRLLFFILIFLIPNLSYSQDFKGFDTITQGTYNFTIFGKRIDIELESYLITYKSINNKSTIQERYSQDSILKTKDVYYKNIDSKDSIRYTYVNNTLKDSCIWKYDSLKREIYYLWHSLGNKDHETLNWIYEYKDTIINESIATIQVRYRIDNGINYVDTSGQTTTITNYENGYIIKETETDNFDEKYVKQYFYDKNYNLLKITKKNYSGNSLTYELEERSKNNCETEQTIKFPQTLTLFNEKELNAFIEEYRKDFNHKKCRPEILVLKSENNSKEIRIVRGACHTSNSGSMTYLIRK